MKRAEMTCFVIMPFTVRELDKSRYPDPNHWNEVYDGLIAPAVHRAGLICERDDQDIGARLIVESILAKIEKSDLVLCDLSSHNANVFLELGWALRSDRPFVLIKDDKTEHTFDLNQQFTYEYEQSLKPIALRRETEELAQAIRHTIEDLEQRFSVVRRLSLSLSAIKASKEGDLQLKLLADIQRNIEGMQKSTSILESKGAPEFPWPGLLNRATVSLHAFSELFDAAGSIPSVEDMGALAERLKIVHQREIQVSVIGQDRTWVFHDWLFFIGEPAGFPDGGQVIDDVFLRSYGAVAWTDRTSNVKVEYRTRRYERLSIGL